jgi:hypothetical protein
MKTQAFICLFVSLSALGLQSVESAVRGGGMDSGGGDLFSADQGAAWFLGDREVKYCLEVSSDFGESPANLKDLVEGSFQQWFTYLNERSTKSGVSTEGLPIAQKRRLLRTCDGTQDLSFYFGVTSAEIEKAKARFSSPVAFAHRIAYDLDQGWGSGFIWIARNGGVSTRFPDWSRPSRLKGMILHEIGHVLGNSHLAGTIMDERLADMLSWPQDLVYGWNLEDRFSHIDGPQILMRCKDCSMKFSGTISHDPSSTEAKQTFKRFVGRAPQGRIVAKVRMIPGKGSLVLADEIGRSEFALTVNDPSDVSTIELGAKLFKRALRTTRAGVTQTWWAAEHVVNAVGFMEIPAVDGIRYAATFEIGMNSGPIRLRYAVNGKRQDLFVTRAPAVVLP